LKDAIEAIKGQIQFRLDSTASDASEDEDSEGDEDNGSFGGDETGADTQNGGTNSTPTESDVVSGELDGTSGAGQQPEEPIELGRSLLYELLKRLDDEAWCAAHQTDLRDLAKPATVIDGQHRILAAAQCERSIPFSVCAIFDCDWAEQVFQFTVVNYTARGIPDQFITANAALSLTKAELAVLQDRLVQAGVKVIEYELMRVVQFDSESPFYDLVNLTDKGNPEKIGYKAMVRLAKMWYSGKHPAFSHLLQGLYPDLPGNKAARKRLDRWREGDWGIFFKDFWQTAYKRYSSVKSEKTGHGLWTPGNSNLLTGVVLQELQEAFLDHLAQQDVETFFTAADKTSAVKELRARVEKRADTFLKWIPGEFFAADWLLKSLNIGPGREALQQVFDQFVKTKGKYQYAKSAFFTGQISG
jgi:hypothetical protein